MNAKQKARALAQSQAALNKKAGQEAAAGRPMLAGWMAARADAKEAQRRKL